MTEKKKSSMRPQKQNWEDKRGSREGSQLIGSERRTWADSSRWMATLSMCHEWAFQPRSLSEHPHTYSTYSTYTYGHITHVCSSCARRGGWVLTARLAAPRHTHWSFHSSPPAQKYQSWHRTWAGLGARSVCVCVCVFPEATQQCTTHLPRTYICYWKRQETRRHDYCDIYCNYKGLLRVNVSAQKK